MLVVVTDEIGAPVPGARVLVRPPEEKGAIALSTDAEGRAEVVDLAEGEWQVDVQREGFMMLTAYVRLASGKSPKLAFSSKQRTGTYWAELQAVFLPTGTKLTPAVAAGMKSPDEVRKTVEAEVKDERRAEERAEQQQRRGRLARVIEQPPNETAAATSPANEPVAPAVSAAGGAAVVADRATLPSSQLRQAGACPECRPGERSLTTSTTVAAGSAEGACAVDESLLRQLAGDLGNDLARTTTDFAGPLMQEDGNDASRLLSAELRGAVTGRLAQAVLGDGCVAIGVVLPRGARYVGFRYRAGTETTKGDCLLRQPCQTGNAEWPAAPLIVETASGPLVWSFFRSTGAAAAEAEATIYFRPARGWLPPPQ